MIDNDHVQLILASASPRRRDLLGLLGLRFEVRAAGVPETPADGEAPLDYVRRVARHKAEAIANSLEPGSAQESRLIIAADTEVVFEGQVLGKPKDAADAAAMLTRLRGQTHEVISAVVVMDRYSGQTEAVLCQSAVPMRWYSEAELAAYVASGDPLDKAGGYAIQHAGFHPVEGFRHCYASVMGLPLCHLTAALRRMGVNPPADVPTACQKVNNYDCPIFAEVLADSWTQS